VCSFVLLFVRVVDIVNDCCYRQRNYSRKKKIHKHIYIYIYPYLSIYPSRKNTRSIKSNVTHIFIIFNLIQNNNKKKKTKTDFSFLLSR
jgi:hypothetical protein